MFFKFNIIANNFLLNNHYFVKLCINKLFYMYILSYKFYVYSICLKVLLNLVYGQLIYSIFGLDLKFYFLFNNYLFNTLYCLLLPWKQPQSSVSYLK